MTSINKKYIDDTKFSLSKLDDVQVSQNSVTPRLFQGTPDLLEVVSQWQPTELKHIKSPVSLIPAYMGDTPPATNNITAVWISLPYIELEGKLLHIRPFIIDLTNSSAHKFNDDTDYVADRNPNSTYSKPWFYIYFGLNSDSSLDVKVCCEDPYLYGTDSETPITPGDDPLYIYKNDKWYRCVGVIHYAGSNLLAAGNRVHPSVYCTQNKYYLGRVTLLSGNISWNSETSVNFKSRLPVNIGKVWLAVWNGYMRIERKDGGLGTWMLRHYAGASNSFTNLLQYIEHAWLTPECKLSVQRSSYSVSGGFLLYLNNFEIY